MRDVERAMTVIMWFYSNSQLIDQVIEDGDSARGADSDSSEESSEEENDEDAREIAQDEQVRFFTVYGKNLKDFIRKKVCPVMMYISAR